MGRGGRILVRIFKSRTATGVFGDRVYSGYVGGFFLEFVGLVGRV